VKRTWTIIGVADVARSFNWYQRLFGQAETAPVHDHPTLTSAGRAEPGNGLLLFFRVDDFDAALARARKFNGRLEVEPRLNPATGTREYALRDPDGYYIMISALS